MKDIAIFVLIALSFVLSGLLWFEMSQSKNRTFERDVQDPGALSVVINEGSERELAVHMARLSYHTHKLDLSVASQNQPAAAFYLHELNEVVEAIEAAFPDYEGHPVANLMNDDLGAKLALLETSIDGANWDAANRNMVKLIGGCNQCHSKTGYAELRVRQTSNNPFNQEF